MTNKVLTREELYELVWEKPTSQLAKDFNISDSAIAKWCRKMEVPKPPRGYWAKKKSYAKVKKTPLKPLSLKGVSLVQYNPAPPVPKKEKFHVEVPDDIKIVKGSLRSQHPLVREAKAMFKKAKPDRLRNVYDLRYKEVLDIQVSPASLDRALLFFDSLLKTVERMGAEVRFVKDYQWVKTVISFKESAIQVGIYETGKRSQTPEPVHGENSFLGYDRYQFTPTGYFSFRIHNAYYRVKGEWKENAKTKLDGHFKSILQEFYRFNEAIKQEAIKAREEARLREIRRQEEQRRLAEIEKEKRLLKTAEEWDVFAKLEAFLDAVESTYPDNPKAKEYVQWGRGVAEKVDPIKKLKKQFDDESE
ncbi:hypothetical protein BerOc1_03087 [Pseudodesulfovibrio hydrargyri]|uniref:Uncharacterized protein n=1 Tax=Pseudodesulfovibrio hydrargyri TaxID=2125990 RepID=A0A1J5MX91_9BACT|nr:hypothetical protein [Pseudodesulfovibrio hydrargyri]OIQ51142.1 hypothetical protein BerOc1_03087 [Pseudodesulfovibrio hydrargyri]